MKAERRWVGWCVVLAVACSGIAALAQEAGPGERPAHRHPPLKLFDTNEDGEISKAEFMAGMAKLAQKRFDRIDANDDGVLTKDELRAARHRQRPQGGPGGGPGGGKGPQGLRRGERTTL